MIIAKDVMRKDVVTVHENLTVRELAALLLDRKITGVPVVNDRGRVVGVVSQTDLVRRGREIPETAASGFYDADERWLDRKGYAVEIPDYTRVSEIMTPAVLCAEEDTPIQELARLMVSKHVHRLVIMNGGKLKGIVTSMDLLRTMVAVAR